MTHPTKAIYKWLIQDSVRVSNTTSTSDQRTDLYTEQDHLSTLPRIETIDFYTTHTVSSIRVTPYPAGHVLGAAMFLVNIAGLNIFFTGDYSREQDRHLVAAAVPKNVGKIDVMISESTFGISNAPPRAERETALLKSISSILNRGGKVLMPVFALGRAQELLLILEDYWSRHPELQKIPIYYTGNTARKCMVIYQTYINAMNDNIKRIFRERMAEAEASGNSKGASAGPWDFRFVRSLRNLDRFDDMGGCVMLASPGMLQSGMSRTLLERWAPDQRNGVVMTGYNIEGTMARTILQEPDSIPAVTTGGGAIQRMGKREEKEVMIPRRCTVQEFSFAAHVTGVENVDFIEEIGAPHVVSLEVSSKPIYNTDSLTPQILVHGERGQGSRLKSKLLSLNIGRTAQTQVHHPPNCEEVRIPFRKDKTARVVGRLAQIQPPTTTDPEDARLINGVLVQNGFKLSLMAPEDLHEYAGLTTTTIMCKQHILLNSASAHLIKWALESMFGAIEEISHSQSQINGKAEHVNGLANGKIETIPSKFEEVGEMADEELPAPKSRSFLIMGCVKVTCFDRSSEIDLEWGGNTMNDGIADAVMAVLLTVESSPAAVKHSSSKHPHHHHHNHDSMKKVHNAHAELSPEDRFSRLCMFLEEQFGQSIKPIEHPKLRNNVNGAGDAVLEGSSDDEDDIEEIEAQERARLAALGLPVPGLEIKVDKHLAKLWLENLEVECANNVLRDRVKAVVERAVETVAPLWTVKNMAHR